MSPRQKSHKSPDILPKDHHNPTPREERRHKKSSTISTSTFPSSIPTLPEVHKAPSAAPQGSLLHTLLAEERLEIRDEDERGGDGSSSHSREGSSSSSRSVGSKTKGKAARQEGQGHGLTTFDRSPKLSGTLDTMTARSDKILTSSWSGTGDTADTRRRGQRRRRSQDGVCSTRRLSGSLPSKKKLQLRPGHGPDHKRSAGSLRRPSTPTPPDQDVFMGDEDLSQIRESEVVSGAEDSSSVSLRSAVANIPGDLETSASNQAHNTSASAKDCAESTHGLPGSEKLVSANIFPDLNQPNSDSFRTPSDTKTAQTLQIGNSRHAEKTSSVSAERIPRAWTSGSQQTPTTTSGSVQVTDIATSSLSVSGTSLQGKQPSTNTADDKTSTPFNQWTTCRALDDSDDENDDGDDRSLEHPRTPDHDTHDLYTVVTEGSMADGRLSRATSSNHPRRKRPLLLPPIMLPPVYTMKPTPLRLRDDVYFAGSGPRTSRPISDEEWDKLRDCRYLRIPILRRSLKA